MISPLETILFCLQAVPPVLVLSFVCGLAILVAVGLVFAMLRRFYRVPPPGCVLLRSGHGGPRAATESGIWVLPMIHRADMLSLAPFRIDLENLGADAKPFNLLRLPNVFYIQLATTDELVQYAAQSVVSMSPEDVAKLAEDLVRGELDRFLAVGNDETLESSPSDRFAAQVEETLNTVGLTIVSFQWQ